MEQLVNLDALPYKGFKIAVLPLHQQELLLYFHKTQRLGIGSEDSAIACGASVNSFCELI